MVKEYSATSPQSSWEVKVADPPFQLEDQVQMSHCGTVVEVSSELKYRPSARL